MKAQHKLRFELRLGAPAERVWDMVTDPAAMAQWIGFSQVWLSHAGTPEPRGLGAERSLVDPLMGTVVERVVDWRPVESYRYRIVSGSPFREYEGEVALNPQDARTTDVVLKIQFRPRWTGTGILLKFLLAAKLRAAMRTLNALVQTKA